MWGRYGGDEWRPYVSVAQKLSKAKAFAAKVAKKEGRNPLPVAIQGRKIATTFWGKAWCDNLEAYSDFSNRLPRGATYARNGSVVDLVIESRKIQAIVAGSETYKVTITIAALEKRKWTRIKQDCSASIDSLLDLLAGRFSESVMQRLMCQGEGMFPAPKEIKMACSCPDYSYCCKHIAAVMYGVGNRLDHQPELIFLLRNVNQEELVSQATAVQNIERELASDQTHVLAGQDLGDLFGIELESAAAQPTAAAKRRGAKKSAKPSKSARKTSTRSTKPIAK